jgi:hypothetical protein
MKTVGAVILRQYLHLAGAGRDNDRGEMEKAAKGAGGGEWRGRVVRG